MQLKKTLSSQIGKYVLGAACAFALGACSGGQNSGSQQSSSQGSAPAASNSAAPAGGSGASGQTKIAFWHSMDGELGKTLQGIVDNFNNSQKEYKVETVYKGGYQDSMNAAIAAYRAKQAPEIAQVYEVGTATMMYSGGAIKPVQEMSEQVGDPIDPKNFVGAVAGYYSSSDGKLVSMPFNSSTPILYYNKDMYTKAGLDPNVPPKTYADLKEHTKKLKAAGFECGYTTTWPSWILLETFSAWHNIPYASKNNGFDGLDARLQVNNPTVLRLVKDLKEMSKDGEFTYGGRADDAMGLFISGKCGILTASSGSRSQIISDGKFAFGVGKLPYYQDVQGAPQNSIIGGASLWVFNGKDDNTYKGVVKFLKYLSSPEVAAKWHQDTGYVPVTNAAYQLTKDSGYYEKNPGADVPYEQLSPETTASSRGVRLGSLPDIRDVEEGAMEKVFNGSLSPEDALKEIETKGNEILQKFEDTHKQ